MQDSINHMPAHHPLVIWLYYIGLAKYDLAKFGRLMKQEGLIFINFTFLGGGSFLNLYWRRMKYCNLIKKIRFKKIPLLFFCLSRYHKIKQNLYLDIIKWYIITWNKYIK